MPLISADDTCLFVSHSNLEGRVREANEELSKISDWFKVSKLS